MLSLQERVERFLNEKVYLGYTGKDRSVFNSKISGKGIFPKILVRRLESGKK